MYTTNAIHTLFRIMNVINTDLVRTTKVIFGSFLLFLFSVIFFSCSTNHTKKASIGKQIEVQNIKQIQIIQVADLYNSSHYYWKELSQHQTKQFVEKWNAAKSIGDCKKQITSYFIVVYFYDGNMREFQINGRIIKEKTNTCFEINEPNFFDDLYAKAKLVNH